MEIILEIPEEKVKAFNIKDSKICFEELQRKIALGEMTKAMYEAQEAAKMYGIDKLTMDDVNLLVKEAKEEHAKQNNSD